MEVYCLALRRILASGGTMSKWFTPKATDIDLDLNQNEVDIYVTSDNSGNIYLSLTFNQIKSIYNKIISLEEQSAEKIQS